MKKRRKNYKTVYSNGHISLCEYAPTLFHPFGYKLQPISFVRKIRYILEFLRPGKYSVFYLETEGKIIGECVIEPGGGRLKCASKTDVVVGGPYYIIPEYRKKGYAKEMILMALKHYKKPYKHAFAYIGRNNIASIKTVEACGFRKIAEADIVGVFHKIIQKSIGGGYYIYKL